MSYPARSATAANVAIPSGAWECPLAASSRSLPAAPSGPRAAPAAVRVDRLRQHPAHRVAVTPDQFRNPRVEPPPCRFRNLIVLRNMAVSTLLPSASGSTARGDGAPTPGASRQRRVAQTGRELTRGSRSSGCGPLRRRPRQLPWSRAARHIARWKEYSPSRRSGAPTAPGVFHPSAARTIPRLYSAVNRRRCRFATTSTSGSMHGRRRRAHGPPVLARPPQYTPKGSHCLAQIGREGSVMFAADPSLGDIILAAMRLRVALQSNACGLPKTRIPASDEPGPG